MQYSLGGAQGTRYVLFTQLQSNLPPDLWKLTQNSDN